MARDVLHDGHGALADERDRHRVGAHAVARDAAGGVESFEDAGLGSVGRTPLVVPQDEVVGMELGTAFPIGTWWSGCPTRRQALDAHTIGNDD